MEALSNDKNPMKRGKTLGESSGTETRKVEKPKVTTKPSTMNLKVQKQKSKDSNKLKAGKEVKRDDDYVE